MQRAQLCAGLGIGFMLATSSAQAGQVELSVETRVGGDSNVFRSEDPVEDGTFDIAPRLSVSDVNDDLDYSVFYQPTYRSFMETSGIDGVDHRARGSATWEATAIDSLALSGSYYNGRQFLLDSTTSGAGDTFSVNDRERIRIADGQLGYERLLSPRLSLGVVGSFDDFDASGTSPNSQTDSRAYTGQISATYMLTQRAQIGLSGSGRRRENRAVGPFRVSARTDVWDVMGSVSYSITPTISASVQAGPSFIRQQQIPAGARDPSSPECLSPPDFECPRYGREEAHDVTLFAAASARKEWQQSDLEISYLRTEARSGNVASSSSINDRVQLAWNGRVNDRLTLRALGAWNRYEEIVAQQGAAGRFKLESYRTTETVEFVISRRILLIGQYTYLRQTNDLGTQGFSNKIDVHTGFLGIRYTFEPLSY